MKEKMSVSKMLAMVFQGALIGFGFILPGISGGVLCVIFGIYKPIMEFLADPIKRFKTHVPKLFPIAVGFLIGTCVIAKVLSKALEMYPAQCVSLFVGLIIGMIPSLYKEAGEQGRNKASFVAMGSGFVLILALLIGLMAFSVTIVPNFGWNMFIGFCLALSIIAPGMSSSTFLMPMGLYDVMTNAIGDLNISVLVPIGIGGLATVLLFAKLMDSLLKKHYSVSFHAITGVVIAATIMTIPSAALGKDQVDFLANTATIVTCVVLLTAGVVAGVFMEKFNSKFSKE